jgi:hypothetical protein
VAHCLFAAVKYGNLRSPVVRVLETSRAPEQEVPDGAAENILLRQSAKSRTVVVEEHPASRLSRAEILSFRRAEGLSAIKSRLVSEA